VIDHIVYDSFGNITTQTNASNADRFLFAGMQYDSTTGIYYDHARYYDAAIGRFMSQDPMGFAAGDANLYRYVGNSPTDMTDLSGLGSLGDLVWQARLRLTVPPPAGESWNVQNGVGNSSTPITGSGKWSRVDGLWTPGGYLKIPNGTTVWVVQTSPGGAFKFYNDGTVYWYPVTVWNPQGNNPSVPNDNNGNKPKGGFTTFKRRWWK
jgi:RHS repeat-associated protein